MLKLVEFGIIGIALFGLLVSVTLMFSKNLKIEKMIFDATGVVSVIAFLLFSIYVFFAL